jgi:hypothetical protein
MADDETPADPCSGKAQNSLSRARMTVDPNEKKMWAHIADEWVQRVHELEDLQEQKARDEQKPL